MAEEKEEVKVVCSNCGRELKPTDEYWRVGNDPVLSKYFGANQNMIFCSRECIQKFLFVQDGSEMIKKTDDYHADEIENAVRGYYEEEKYDESDDENGYVEDGEYDENADGDDDREEESFV